MQITLNIKDSIKGKAFLDFIKSLDFITVEESDVGIDEISMSEREIIDRVAVTNDQITNKDTISQDDLEKESQNW